MEKVKVFAPATVANVGSGFDILGFAFEGVGDIIEMSKSEIKGVHITEILSEKSLSTNPEKNTAGRALLSMLKKADVDFGVNLKIKKGVNPGSGTGSSAASASGAVFALNQLLDDKDKFKDEDLVNFAMDGEVVASGARHADNVAPCLLGNFTLIRENEPLDLVKIKSPDQLYAVVIHPEIEIKTSDSRAILKKQIPLELAVKQWGNVGGLIAGLFTSDYDLIGRSIEDHIVTPTRSMLIPMYDELKNTALKNGALAYSVSGSGPSMFAMCKGKDNALKVEKAIIKLVKDSEIKFNLFNSKIADKGCAIIE